MTDSCEMSFFDDILMRDQVCQKYQIGSHSYLGVIYLLVTYAELSSLLKELLAT